MQHAVPSLNLKPLNRLEPSDAVPDATSKKKKTGPTSSGTVCLHFRVYVVVGAQQYIRRYQRIKYFSACDALHVMRSMT